MYLCFIYLFLFQQGTAILFLQGGKTVGEGGGREGGGEGQLRDETGVCKPFKLIYYSCGTQKSEGLVSLLAHIFF